MSFLKMQNNSIINCPVSTPRTFNNTSSLFLDLIQDWSSDSAPDIFSFVPYSWNFKIMFHQFEMIWASNQHNWIDCSTKQQENGENCVF